MPRFQASHSKTDNYRTISHVLLLSCTPQQTTSVRSMARQCDCWGILQATNSWFTRRAGIRYSPVYVHAESSSGHKLVHSDDRCSIRTNLIPVIVFLLTQCLNRYNNPTKTHLVWFLVTKRPSRLINTNYLKVACVDDSALLKSSRFSINPARVSDDTVANTCLLLPWMRTVSHVQASSALLHRHQRMRLPSHFAIGKSFVQYVFATEINNLLTTRSNTKSSYLGKEWYVFQVITVYASRPSRMPHRCSPLFIFMALVNSFARWSHEIFRRFWLHQPSHDSLSSPPTCLLSSNPIWLPDLLIVFPFLTTGPYWCDIT